jgi:hypothetical protein
MITIGSRVKLAHRHDPSDGVGIVRELHDVNGRQRALVGWRGSRTDQFVDVDKLVVVP